ncbi:hypothetical protein [Parasitella parasitica]|uniref:Uncharacterized protein n=1 Tax=Parasitella parasitica TaxID=35722 RepID=A0A0B7NI25_9FUNG|nr:hypothetical protein [Parasitella parasitica]
MSQNSQRQYKADPYRAARKPPSPDGYYDSPPTVNSDQFHSRSPSESSTSKLANTITGTINQDPYAPTSHIKKKKYKPATPAMDGEKRANSYLPYSNHSRNPYDPVEPIYLDRDDDYLPSFNSPGQYQQRGSQQPVGSILQDNIIMDMMNDHHNINDDTYETKPHLEQILPPIKKKKWWTKYGLSGRRLVVIAFVFIIIVGVLTYFVWPRTPTLQFLDATLENGSQPTYNDTMLIANWNVSFTVYNNDNFIPTNIQNLAVSVIENGSGDVFGRGNSGHWMLKPKSQDQVINIPISIDFHRDATNQAIKTLANACKIKEVDSANAPKQSLSITFEIVYYVAGIVWHPVARVSPTTYFDCPS